MKEGQFPRTGPLSLYDDPWTVSLIETEQWVPVFHVDRARNPKPMRVIALFRRFSNSLCAHGRSLQNKPLHQTTTDFFSALNAEPHRYAIRCRQARPPTLRTDS